MAVRKHNKKVDLKPENLRGKPADIISYLITQFKGVGKDVAGLQRRLRVLERKYEALKRHSEAQQRVIDKDKIYVRELRGRLGLRGKDE